MKFERTNPDCSFSVPDKITVRMQMEYASLATLYRPGAELWERLWNGAKTVIEPDSWKCPVLPKIDTDLDEVTDPNITEILIWASAQVKNHIDELGNVPKN